MQKKWWIKIHDDSRIMEFKFTGTWTSEDANQWSADFRVHADQMVKKHSGGFDFLVDMSEYPPQSDEVKEAHKSCAQYVTGRGLHRSAHIVNDPDTMIQMRRLMQSARELETFKQFQFRADAVQWLDNHALQPPVSRRNSFEPSR
jgi:hypothetical protein